MIGLNAFSASTAGGTAGRGSGGCSPAAPSAKGGGSMAVVEALWTAGLSSLMLAVLSGHGMISTTSCWPLPSAVFSICVLDTITGSVTSRITRVLLTPDSPARNDLTRPTGVAVGCEGRRSFVSSTSITTRLGPVSEKTSKFAVFGNPMRKRVR